MRAVGVPSSFHRSFLFCSVEKKPGAMALQRMPRLAKCTASHWVKLEMPDLAALYAGILVSGVKAFMELMFRMQPPLSVISRAKAWVGISVPMMFRSKTLEKPSVVRSKKLFLSGSFSVSGEKNSSSAVASG